MESSDNFMNTVKNCKVLSCTNDAMQNSLKEIFGNVLESPRRV